MKILGTSLLVVFLAGIGIGQIGKDVVERERWNQLQEEHEKRVAELNGRLDELRNPAPRFVDSFVGRTGNSWAVSLVSEGGFFGFRTVASINSDKKAYCGFEKDSMVLVDVPDELISRLQIFVDRPPHVKMADADQPAGCKDCSTESIVVSIRSGSDIRSRTYTVDRSSERVSQIYDALYDFGGCRVNSGEAK